MEKACSVLATERHVAVVTGGNKGIGFEVCKQLACSDVMVVLTATAVSKGQEAVEEMQQFGCADSVVFHQLDVADSSSIMSLAAFIRSEFGRLDILVNNAAISGAIVSGDALRAATELAGDFPVGTQYNWDEIAPTNYELTQQGLKINYYGTKAVTESLIPLLQLSHSPRIVNVSSALGSLKLIKSESVNAVLNNVEELREEKLDEILNEFLRDFKEGSLDSRGWPPFLSAYIMSKIAMNAYTKILAKKHPNVCVNSVAPGYVKTDLTGNNGFMTPAEGASFVVRVALMKDGAQTGIIFNKEEAHQNF